MKSNLFRKVGRFYCPVSVVGWALTAVTVILPVWVFHVIYKHLHSTSHTLMYLFPYAVVLLVLLWRTASKTSARDNH